MTIYEFTVTWIPRRYNSNCGAVTGGYYEAEIVSNLPQGVRVYSGGQQTANAAVADLIQQAQRLGFSGTLKRV